MKKVVLILLFILPSKVSQAQLMVQEGNVWTYCHALYMPYDSLFNFKPYLVELWFVKYYFHGEREMNGKIYKEVWTQTKYTMSWNPPGVFPPKGEEVDETYGPHYFLSLREEDGKVYGSIREFNQYIQLPEEEWDQPYEPLTSYYPAIGDEYVVYDASKDTIRSLPFIGKDGLSKETLILPWPLKATDGFIHEDFLNLFFLNGELAYQSPDFMSDPFYPEVGLPRDYRPFLEEGKEWYNDLMLNFDSGIFRADHYFCGEEEMVYDTVNINGKEYQRLLCSIFYMVGGVKRKINAIYPILPLRKQVLIAVREEQGKVYAVKEQYFDLLKEFYPQEYPPYVNPDDFFLAEAEDENEVLLYDFTLEEGQRYPYIGEVYVSKVSSITTQDGLKRKVMELSNGAILIEGIGCVNSIGGIIVYQNINGICQELSNGEDNGKIAYARLSSCYTKDNEGTHYRYTNEADGSFIPYMDVSYRPFIEEGKVWTVGYYPRGEKLYQIESYYFEGDTIVANQPCKKLMCRTDFTEHWSFGGDTSSTIEYRGAMFETGKRVYVAEPGRDSFVLLYDFASAVGDTIRFRATEFFTRSGIVTQKTAENSNLFKGHVVRVAGYTTVPRGDQFVLDYNFRNPIVWREGVGNWKQPLDASATDDDLGIYYLLISCTFGDEILYVDPLLYNDIEESLNHEVKKQWLDFTHTVKTKPKGPRKDGSPSAGSETGVTEEGSGTDEAQALTGEYSAKELFVSLQPLAGPYTVSISNAAGEVVYEKEVQTSSVVALNTDLSKYPDGSYTLVVENDDEAYTAQLNIGEGNGIRDIGQLDNLQLDKGHSSIFHPQSSIYYDLSGRRLSAPPAKGLYIQDKRVKIRE